MVVHPRGSGRAGAGVGEQEALGVTQPSVEGRLTSKREEAGPRPGAPLGRRARSQEPGDATPAAAPMAPAQSLPRRVSELLRVAPPEGRGNSACTPRQLALRERGGGDTPARRLRTAEINAGYRRPVINRRGAGERLAGGAPPRAAGAAGLPVPSAGAPKSGAAEAVALPAPARNSRPHFPLLPAPSLQ